MRKRNPRRRNLSFLPTKFCFSNAKKLEAQKQKLFKVTSAQILAATKEQIPLPEKKKKKRLVTSTLVLPRILEIIENWKDFWNVDHFETHQIYELQCHVLY